ncbi:MAG: FAD-binding oxidoreductase [Candidatus Acidiferrales bacterium]
MTSQPHAWGSPPWKIDFRPPQRALPAHVDFAVIGAGFTGLAAATWLRRLAPKKSVAVLEAARIGAGASGRTGGMSLSETAAGPQRGLGDVLSGFENILKKLSVKCDLRLGGAWEIARGPGDKGLKRSAIHWNDSGTLRVVNEVPGGTLDPGKLVSGLAGAAHRFGAKIYENHRVLDVHWNAAPEIHVGDGRGNIRKLTAAKIVFATNAQSLDVSGLQEGMHPRLTLAVLAKPVSEKVLKEIGLAERKPFYTVDFPYLWGRVRPDRSIVWGAGLVQSPDEDDLDRVDIAAPEPAQIFARLEDRVRRLHPALAKTKFTHRWGGPILFRDNWKPVFDWHPQSLAHGKNAVVIGAFAGHGVALSSYLGTWAAEVLLGQRKLPAWGAIRP